MTEVTGPPPDRPRPIRVTLTKTPTPINHRRLSSQFTKPTSPVKANVPTMAWVSLQGRLVGAEEATSARRISGGLLSPKEAVAWELFSPIHRVLIVAVVAAAVAKEEKGREVSKLRDCVRFRDQILTGMQQKLDNLCQQMNCTKEHPQATADMSEPENIDLSANEAALSCKSGSICTHCWLCDQHRAQINDLSGEGMMKGASGDETFRSRVSISNEEQEERRMSDLSDWASSVTSAADIQLNNLAIEQDIFNLRRQCELKDAALKELSTFIRSKDVVSSKRIEELEDIIRRKNSTITRLKKDMIVLEQKVVNLTRARRRSFPGPSMETKKQLTTMTDNLIYDMDSPTSSSDSDCSSQKPNTPIAVRKEADALVDTPVRNNVTSDSREKRSQKSAPAKITSSAPVKITSSFPKLSVQIPKSRPVTPLKEKSLNHPASPRATQVPASVAPRNNRRRSQSGSKDIAPHKRWV